MNLGGLVGVVGAAAARATEILELAQAVASAPPNGSSTAALLPSGPLLGEKGAGDARPRRRPCGGASPALPSEATRRRICQHEGAHLALGYLFDWKIRSARALAHEDGFADVVPREDRGFETDVQWLKIYAIADLWVQLVTLDDPEHYATVLEPLDVLADWGEIESTPAPIAAGYVAQSDEPNAMRVAREITSSELSAGLLLGWVAEECRQLVRTERFAVLARCAASLLERYGEADGRDLAFALERTDLLLDLERATS